MSWLDFANHFLSNQRLHAWSWINRTFLGNGFFFVGTLALSVPGLFLFWFCLVWGEQATDTQDFGWQSKGEDHFRSWFSFFSCLLVTILYCSDIVWSKDLSAHFFCFLSILDQELSFLFFLPFLLSPILWLGIFFLFFLLSPTLWFRISFLFFLLSPTLWLGISFLFFFAFSLSLIGNFLSFFFPRVRIDILTLGQGLWWVRILAQGL